MNRRAELTCLRLNWRFIRRHRRYFTIFVIVYGYSILGWRRTRGVRFCYALAQHIDDLLDGDCPCEREPLEVVDEVIRQFEQEEFDDSELGNLARSVAQELKRLRTSTDDPLTELITLFRVMRFDRQRVRDGLVLAQDRLARQHWETFYHSVNLLLVVARADLRADDAVDLIKAFGWCSTMRDLREDIDRGLINLPRDVVEHARAQGSPDLTYDSLTAMPAVKEWIRAEHAAGRVYLDQFARRLAALRGRKGARILMIFLESMDKFHRRFIKLHPEFFAAGCVPAISGIHSSAESLGHES